MDDDRVFAGEPNRLFTNCSESEVF